MQPHLQQWQHRFRLQMGQKSWHPCCVCIFSASAKTEADKVYLHHFKVLEIVQADFTSLCLGCSRVDTHTALSFCLRASTWHEKDEYKFAMSAQHQWQVLCRWCDKSGACPCETRLTLAVPPHRTCARC